MAGHVGHDDERIGMRDREGLQQHRVEQAEHGGVGADAEAEGEDRGGRESGRTRQPAQAVAHIGAQFLQNRQPRTPRVVPLAPVRSRISASCE